MTKQSVCMIGLGYIGLPTAAIIASRGLKVTGVDIDKNVVETINSGAIHIYEPDLDVLVRSVVEADMLRCQTEPASADVYMIAVPTPFKNDKEPELKYVEAAARSIAPKLQQGNLVILESTSPVGTTEKVAQWLASERPDLSFPQSPDDEADIALAYCPERVLPGKILSELVNNDRLIGGISKRCTAMATSLYANFVEGGCVATNARTAELAKLSENAFRDVNIAFANELSLICGDLDVNVWELIRLANRHPRVNILNPGPGVGGHCIAVDPWFIVSQSPDSSDLIRTARQVNDGKPEWVLEKIADAAKLFEESEGRAAKIACYGITFKPDIDDLRESPSLDIAARLTGTHAADVIICEPNISELPSSLSKAKKMNADEVAKNADLHVILVGHKSFRAIDFNQFPSEFVLDFCGFNA
jgi:UDP-N-acetyl-D-mannosaminuronic acid dehydrogenase